ncbi:MAG: HD domain-containing phosphohydrolase [Azonexus sp.]|nr:HD domain-containing phosphohydrolase [Azonexus sp.]
MTRRFPLHIHISTLFIVLILLIGGFIGWLGYSVASNILRTSTSEMNARIGKETENAFKQLLAPAEMATRILSHSAITVATSLDERLASLALMREALKDSEALTGLYVGYGNGDFFLLRRVEGEADRQFFQAPDNTSWLIQSIDRPDGQARGRYLFLDTALKTLKIEEHPNYPNNYDPRARDWYKAALAAGGQIKTAPYLFYSSRKVGTTIANRASRDESVVVGADIRLETLDQMLAGQRPSPSAQIVLTNQQGRTIAYQDPSKGIRLPKEPDGKPTQVEIAELSPVFAEIAPLLPTIDNSTATIRQISAAGETWHASIHPIKLEGANPLYLVIGIPDSELMVAANQLLRHSLLAIALVILLAIPITWALARAISGPMRKLAGEAETIRHFDFSQPISVKSLVLEINELATTMDEMKRTIRRFLDISQAVAGENNFDHLLPKLLSETLSAAGAKAGILYLADQDGLTSVAQLFADGAPLPGNPQTLALADAGPLLGNALAAGKALSGLLTPADIAALGLSEALQASGTSHAIAVPLLNRQDSLVGAMLLLKQNESDTAHLSFIEALSGSAAVSLENKELIHAQKMLFEAMIQLIAGAIDAKSPYTGGHCARVPELTKMLARAACDSTDGPFTNFHLTDDDWEAVHVAAWLHDCGKVTTPEYVVDKATKLETLYDRIHEVRMRFEVLKRDAEIACLKAIAAGTPEAEAQATLAAELQQLDDDFAFIAGCNEGGEFMAPQKLERLASIAARTWQRTLDDRIGISHEENERKARTPPSALPATEPLLADRPEHIFERRAQDRMPPDNKWGFRMPVPELLYNKGELYNLAVARGTLAEEERYKINEHIVQTLIMLSQLPFPKHLREVPEIAACHHEKMDGTGYPRRLVREQMGPVARMMAIADIFEALTAVDRPYKKGKTLSEALRIMAMMRNDAHIDPELFDLFLHAGIWREYAERFMRPEQIDAVDVSDFSRS